MQTYLLNLLPRLRQYSRGLDSLALFEDHPWIRVQDEAENRAVFVFRKGGELLISQNGDVETARWDHLSAMNSIVIQSEEGKALYNHCFLDEAVLALRKDGVQEYLLLGNENKLGAVTEERVVEVLQRRYLQGGREVPETYIGAIPSSGGSTASSALNSVSHPDLDEGKLTGADWRYGVAMIILVVWVLFMFGLATAN